MKRGLRLFKKILFYFFLLLLGLLVTLYFTINYSFVNGVVSDAISSFLSKKTGKEIVLKEFRLLEPNTLELYGVYAEDGDGDTLVNISSLIVDINEKALFDQKLIGEQVIIDGALVKMKYDSVTQAFNFQYFIDTFSSNDIQKDTTKKSPWFIDLSNVGVLITNTRFRFEDEEKELVTDTYTEKICLQSDGSILDSLQFDISKAELINTKSFFRLDSLSFHSQLDLFHVLDARAHVNNLSFQTLMASVINGQFYLSKGDSLIVKMDDINVKSKNAGYGEDQIQAVLENASLSLNDEYLLEKLAGSFLHTDQHTHAERFLFQSNGQKMNGNIDISYPKRESLYNGDLEKIYINDLHVNGSSNVKDALKVMPVEYEVLEQLKQLDFGLACKGSIKDLKINDAFVLVDGASHLEVKGGVKNALTDDREVCLDGKVRLKGQQLKKFISIDSLPFALPDEILSTWSVCGSMEMFAVQSVFVAPGLELAINGKLHQDSLTGQLHLPQFDAKHLMTLDSFEYVSLNAEYGIHHPFDLDSLSFKFSSTIDSIFYTYPLKDINTELGYQESQVTLGLSLSDEAVALQIESVLDIDTSGYLLSGNVSLDTLDLYTLGVMNETFSSKANLDFIVNTNDSLEYLNLDVNADTLDLNYQKRLVRLGALNTQVLLHDTMTKVSFQSPIADLNLNANLPFDSIPKLFVHFYDVIQNKDTLHEQGEVIDFLMVVKDTTEFSDLVPYVDKVNLNAIAFNYNANDPSFNLNVDIPYLSMFQVDIGALNFDVQGVEGGLKYDLTGKDITIVDSLFVKEQSLRGVIRRGAIEFKYNVKDKSDVDRFDIHASFQKNDSLVWVEFQDSLIINYKKWDAEQSVSVEEERYRIHHKNEELRIVTTKNDVRVILDSLKMHELFARNMNFETFWSGEVYVLLEPELFFDIDLGFNDLKIEDYYVGDQFLKVKGSPENLQSELRLKGPVNDIIVQGYYAKDSTYLYGADLKLKHFEPVLVEAFFDDYVDSLKGTVSGRVKVDQPKNGRFITEGELNFDTLSLYSNFLNSTFQIQTGELLFGERKATLDRFVIKDALGSEAKMEGEINIDDNDNVVYDFGGKIERFLAMDTDDKSGEGLYGKVWIASDFTVKGHGAEPEIQTTFDVLEGTSINYELDNSGLSDAESYNDVVRFMAPVDSVKSDSVKKDSVVLDVFGLTFESVINIDPTTDLKIILDPISGDHLRIKGGGKLGVDIKPNSEAQFKGKYQIKEGEYRMTFYEIARRDFKIESGSEIIWYGDPTNPEINLKAAYYTEASPYPLVADQVIGSAMEQLYQESRDFRVNLYLSGFLEDLEMKFSIDYLDENNTGKHNITSRLNEINRDQEELNRQVFSVLLFNSFVSPTAQTNATNVINPFDNVSQMFANQLNNLSKKHVKSVDINWNMSSKQRTDNTGQNYMQSEVGVSVKKQVLNDRVTLEVGTGVEYKNSETIQNTSQYVGNASVEINVTKDGRFRLRFYSKNDNSYLGERIVENGVSFLYRKEYEKFSELFKGEVQDSIKAK